MLTKPHYLAFLVCYNKDMLSRILLVFLIAMVPLIELRGAIPIAVGLDIGLPEWAILLVAVLGNILPVPFIYLFARRFLEWGSRQKWEYMKKFCRFCLNKGEKAGQKLLKKAGNGMYLALFMFVAIPMPGTGAWTGTLAASILDLDFRKTVITVAAGVVTAGLIMLLASLGVFKGILG